ncbi:MAG: hypothetical protein ACYCZL_04195, partial [Polaromonas sp.]
TRAAAWFVVRSHGRAKVTSKGRAFLAFRPNLAVLDTTVMLCVKGGHVAKRSQKRAVCDPGLCLG